MPSATSEQWRWKLRLFVSTDLVGSTAFKASHIGKSRWAPTFKEFFSGFPAFLSSCYDCLPPECIVPEEQLQTWKFSGDEILFWVELRCYQEALSHLYAVKKAMREFPLEWKRKEVPLLLKGTSWLAGFPVTNTEIEIPTNGNGSSVLDFIGPSLDLGFRVARFCDDRRLAVSADLALMLLDGVDSRELDRSHFHLHLHGCEILKGVIANKPYPVLWIDMLDGKPDMEERLRGIRRDFRSDETKDYLRGYIDKTKTLRRPFIDGDPDERYGKMDSELCDIREDMIAEESNRNYLVDGEEERAPASGLPKEVKAPSIKPDEFLPGVP